MILHDLFAHQLVDDRRARLVEAGRRRRRPSTNDLGELVAESGITHFERAVTGVVHRARARGVDPVVVDVLADRQEPVAARERALGVVLTALARSRSDTGDDATAVA
jgi:hypothetical protein